MISPRRHRFRRPASHGTRNRQSCRRSSVHGQRRSARDQSQRRAEGQSWPGDLHSGRRRGRAARATCASTNRSNTCPGSSGARLAFQLAMRAEGKTEEQALPPDQPPAPAAGLQPCPCNWAKLPAPSIAIPCRRRLMCAAWRAKLASIFTASWQRPRRTHQRRRRESSTPRMR